MMTKLLPEADLAHLAVADLAAAAVADLAFAALAVFTAEKQGRLLATGFLLPRAFHFSSGISCLWHRKSRNITVLSHAYTILSHSRPSKPLPRAFHFFFFLAELVVFDIGKVEILQYYLM